ncbi:MAG: hypothetical protein A07HB70_00366 [uncultured archaeon A07HB70]|jgi:hypothetical protein|nr:MAG: hypothetical protein A07HB70_00366 [uncultured archaeon A07HB70]
MSPEDAAFEAARQLDEVHTRAEARRRWQRPDDD